VFDGEVAGPLLLPAQLHLMSSDAKEVERCRPHSSDEHHSMMMMRRRMVDGESAVSDGCQQCQCHDGKDRASLLLVEFVSFPSGVAVAGVAAFAVVA